MASRRKKNSSHQGTQGTSNLPAATASQNADKKGHGRNSHKDYTGAQQVIIPHSILAKGSPCPEEYCDGKVYAFDYGIYVRITGGPLLTTTVYKTEKLRCNLCLTIFEAALPLGVKDAPKYDNRALAIMALSKYFLATPFNHSR